MQSLGGTPEKALKPLSPSRGSSGCAVISAPATDHQARCSVPGAEQGCMSPCERGSWFSRIFWGPGSPSSSPHIFARTQVRATSFTCAMATPTVRTGLADAYSTVHLSKAQDGWVVSPEARRKRRLAFPRRSSAPSPGSGGCRKGRGALQGPFLSPQKSGQGQDEAKSSFSHLLLVALGKSVCAGG